jgi:hypothetical protein
MAEKKEIPMPRTASTVTFGDFVDSVNVADLQTFWKAGANLDSDGKRKMREQVMGSNHTSIWNMVQDVTNIVAGGSNREAPVRMTGKLTLAGVAAALQKYVTNGEPYPVPTGTPAAEQGAPPSTATAGAAASPAANPPAPASGEPPQGVSENVLSALTGLYEDTAVTFESIATGNDFRALLWGIAPDVLKATAEQGIIGDALLSLSKSPETAATVRSILTAAGLDDSQTLAAMRKANPALVTAQHSKAADNLFHLGLVKRQLDGYEGLIRDEAVAIVRKARQRSEATPEQVSEARNTVALDTLGDLLDGLERESKRWAEWKAARDAEKARNGMAENGEGAPEAEKVPYASLSEKAREMMAEADWDTLPASAQQTLANRWKDAPAAAPETPQVAPEAEAETASGETAPETEAPAETPQVAPETEPEAEAPKGNGRQRK